MTLKMMFAILALALTPGLAAAQCAGKGMKSTSASSCGEGEVWDTETQSCVVKPTT
jgi:hypothetical protein